jgi:hypothetical protein
MTISLVELKASIENHQAMLEVLRFTESSERTNPARLGCEVTKPSINVKSARRSERRGDDRHQKVM